MEVRHIFRPEPERWSPPRSVLIAAAVIGALSLVAVVFWVIPRIMVTGYHHLSPSDQLKAQSDIRTSALQLLAGIVLAIGGYFTARNVIINREGQITDRFTKAVDQLGSPERDVRMGGLYALERIAHDSKRDHGPIIEVLMAFVREHSAGTPEDRRKPDADVQAALTIIGRRNIRFDLPTTNLDFGPINLRGAYMSSGHFSRANFYRADLREADLSYAHLERAILTEAKLEGSTFRRAYLDDAWVNSVDIGEWSDLSKARIYGAHMFRADIDHVDLGDAMYDRGTSWPIDVTPRQLGALYDPGGRSSDVHAALSKLEVKNRRYARWRMHYLGRAFLATSRKYHQFAYAIKRRSLRKAPYTATSTQDYSAASTLVRDFESCATLADRADLARRLGISELQLWNRYSRWRNLKIEEVSDQDE